MSIIPVVRLVVLALLTVGCTPSGTKTSGTDAGIPHAGHPEETGGDSGSLEGTSCGYACGGLACDLACANDELFRCTPQGVWHLQESCAASGKKCTFTLINGGPRATRFCQ